MPDRLFIDSSCMKVRRCAGGGKEGPWLRVSATTEMRAKGGRNTKLHALCDGRGRPLVLTLTPGNVHDAKVALSLIDALSPTQELVADGGYDSKALRDRLEARGTKPVIPPRKGRLIQYDYDRAAYKHRNVVERMFCRLKDFRRVATRYDRNATTFTATVTIAALVRYWLS